MKKGDEAIAITKKWINEFVMKYGLCPFAAAGFHNDLVHYTYSSGPDIRKHLNDFWGVINLMLKRDESYISNSFLILPKRLSFKGIMKFASICHEFLREAKLMDRFQVVEFHPKLLFGDQPKDDAAHYINRSPFPMLHILRTDEVEGAIKEHPDISRVPLINISTMREIGKEKLDKILKSYQNLTIEKISQ